MGLHDVAADAVIDKTAQKLKADKLVSPPEWAMFAKTGHSRERPPTNPDWWFVRAASILRRVALLGPIGTEKLRTHYGGRKNLGHAPEHHFKGSGAVIRTILKQLDASGLTKQVEKNQHKGRMVTPKGQALLYSISDQIVAARPKAEAQPVADDAAAKAKPAKKPKAAESPPTE